MTCVCTACGYTCAKEIPALGHNLITETYETDYCKTVHAHCTRCEYSEFFGNPSSETEIEIKIISEQFDMPGVYLDVREDTEDASNKPFQHRSKLVGAFLIQLVDSETNKPVDLNGQSVTIWMQIPSSIVQEDENRENDDSYGWLMDCFIVHVFEDTTTESFWYWKRNAIPKDARTYGVRRDGEKLYFVYNVTKFSPFIIYELQDPPTLSIRNNPGTATLRYGETLTLTADAENLPNGASIVWSADSDRVTLKPSADGRTCDVTSAKNGTVTVTVKIVDADGNPVETDGQEIVDRETVQSKASFLYKLLWFFKRLFGGRMHTVQAYQKK